jgi:transposase-like protein
MRKQYSATYQAEIVQELLKEEKTVSQLASETGIHPTQLKEWKRIAVTRLPELFSRNDRALDEARQHEQKVTELYAEIGRLTTQVNWLKKNLVCNLNRAEPLPQWPSGWRAARNCAPQPSTAMRARRSGRSSPSRSRRTWY